MRGKIRACPELAEGMGGNEHPLSDSPSSKGREPIPSALFGGKARPQAMDEGYFEGIND